ncbi:hypothetical protein [Phnomibacter sp. MR]|uniref:hypothetical protein n=1 Tax=Phnomibacter sp. MR TaxID=3042318 RepID=UPI003A805B98
MHIIINRNKAHIREELFRNTIKSEARKYSNGYLLYGILGIVFLVGGLLIHKTFRWSFDSSIGLSFLLVAFISFQSIQKAKAEAEKFGQASEDRLLSSGGWEKFEIDDDGIAYSNPYCDIRWKWVAFKGYAADAKIISLYLDNSKMIQLDWLTIEFDAESLNELLAFLKEKFPEGVTDK